MLTCPAVCLLTNRQSCVHPQSRIVSTCKSVHRRIVLNTPLGLYINNAWVEPVRGKHMSVVDPADETVITTQCPAATAEDVDAAVTAATKAFAVWGRTSGAYVAAVIEVGGGG